MFDLKSGTNHAPPTLHSPTLARTFARLVLLPLLALAVGLSLVALSGAMAGCIVHPYNRAATQPVTAVDPATTQPAYWLDKPAAAHIQGTDYDRTWRACQELCRNYLLPLDREDYRIGVLSTKPVISKQFFELWRKDAGTVYGVTQDSLSTIRRTLRFEFAKAEDGSLTVTPKVLVERITILERRITEVSQYATIFSGPLVPSQQAVNVEAPVPTVYWSAIGRDPEMEKQVAERVQQRLRAKS